MSIKYLLLGLIITILLSCQSDRTEPPINVFHYNQHNNITSLDPAFAKSQNNIWAVNHIFSTLVELDDHLNVIPSIAKSWSIDESATTYTFKLREDVLFHNNDCFADKTRKLSAHDVEFSYNRLLDTTLNAPGSWIFQNRVNAVRPFEAMDDSTLVIRLHKPFAPFLSLLTMQYTSIIPHESIAYYGKEFYRNPVGTGPFYFKKWVDNQGLFLLKNENFFQFKDSSAVTNIDAVRTSFIGERSIAFLELINERIDFFSGLESGYINTALSPNGVLREKYEGITFLKAPYLNFEYLGINPNAPAAHPLLKEKKFRKALNYGIDRTLMLKSLRNNVGIPADAGVIPKGLPSYSPNDVIGYNLNIQKAKTLLSQFDMKDISEPLVVFTSKDYLDLTTYIAKQWEKIGLTVQIEVMESAVLRNAMRNGEVPIFRASWIADYPDGENFLSMFYSINPAPPNYTRFNNLVFDELYERSISLTHVNDKIAMYRKMDKLLIDEAPVVFLFYDEVALFVDHDTKGISRNALNLLQVKNIVQ